MSDLDAFFLQGAKMQLQIRWIVRRDCPEILEIELQSFKASVQCCRAKGEGVASGVGVVVEAGLTGDAVR